MASKNDKFINRDISWLSFNERVLQEAANSDVPLIERLRFLGIFSNNLDEFFRVRIATLKRLISIGKKAKEALHISPYRLMEEMQEIVITQTKHFESIYDEIQHELQKHKIFIIDETKFSTAQGKFVKEYFTEHVRPALVPIMLNQVANFPYLKDKSIYFAIKLSTTGKVKATQYALVEIPSDVTSRFVELPSVNQNKYIVLLDDIIRYNLQEIFRIFSFTKAEAYTIKITRDAELNIDTDISQSFLEKISKSVKNRQKGDPVRFVFDNHIPKDMLTFITQKMKLKKYDNIIPGGRYHNFKDFIKFPDLGNKTLVYQPIQTLQHKAFDNSKNIFDAIKVQDVMLHFPYQRFSHFIDLLREAAIDPNVKTIKITLYRVAKKSRVMNALINAAHNGKHVTAVVEVQARFDEQANINWARALQDEGIHVIYGVPGLKVHSKLCLISRVENGKLKNYANVSTGNYNEATSNIYCDDSLLTADPRITQDVNEIFSFFEKNYKAPNCKHFILSPLKTRKKFLSLIDAEIDFAKRGKKAGIYLKMNSLADEELILKLYEASKAGVKIKIIVRGICALKAGIPGLSENIEIISIIDKFLEHSRVYIFENDENPLYYISSADWMSRNLDVRIEVSCPVFDKKIQKELRDMLDIQWSDTVKARKLFLSSPVTAAIKKPIRAQVRIYDYLKTGK